MNLDEQIDILNLGHELSKAVLEWWEQHQYDEYGNEDPHNIYDEPPEMVRIAREIKRHEIIN